MPLYGVRDVSPLLRYAPLANDLARAEVVLPRAEILQVMFEIDDAPILDLLPAALHPAIPPSVTYVFWKCAESEVGPFTLAQVRVSCRAAIRPRGFLLVAYCDSAAAAAYLGSRWGYTCQSAEVSLRRNYDRITGGVCVDGRELLTASLVDPQSISGADVAYTPNMNLARVELDGQTLPRLVQVDPEYAFHKAERGRPVVERFDADDRFTQMLRPVYPVSATMTVVDISMPPVRFLTDPDLPAMQGTTTLT